MPDKIQEFRCPRCTVLIPTEYMANKTEIIQFKGQHILLCIGCATRWNKMVAYAEELEAARSMAHQLGVPAKDIVEMRRERNAHAAEDEKLVDEELDVMDKAGIEKAFRQKYDSSGMRTPLDTMREKFMKGVEKEQTPKIILPGGL